MKLAESAFSKRLAIFLLSLALYWAGNARAPLWDRDEPRFAQAAWEMLERGDLVVPTFNGEGRYHKPVFVYWLMMAAFSLLGRGEFAARAFSGLLAALAVVATGLMARDAARGIAEAERMRLEIWTGSMTATSLLLFAVAKAATADSTLFLWVVIVQWMALRMTMGCSDWPTILAFWIAMGLGILTKGPVVPAVWLATLIVSIALRGRDPGLISRHRPFLGLLIVAAICLPWASAAQIRTEGAFLKEAIGVHVVERAVRPFEGHGGSGLVRYLAMLPVYLVVLPLGTFPWSLQAIGRLRALRPRLDVVDAYLVGWLLGPLILFSLVATKLPHYILPVVPAFCMLAAMNVLRADASSGISNRLAGAHRIGSGAFVILGLLLVALPWILHRGELGRVLSAGAMTMLSVGTVAAGLAMFAGGIWSLVHARRAGRWTAAMLVTIVVVELCLGSLAAPAIGSLNPSRLVAEMIRPQLQAGDTVYAVGYHEPSLVFELAHPVVMIDDEKLGIEAAASNAGRTFLIIETNRTRESSDDTELRLLGSVRGFNFAKGQWVDLSIFRPRKGL